MHSLLTKRSAIRDMTQIKHKEYVRNEIIVQLTNEMTQRKKRKVTQAELHKYI